ELIDTGRTTLIESPYAFTGRELGREPGYYYLRARYYIPLPVGFFLSADPLGVRVGDENPYLYAGNNPINRIDPFGLEAYLVSRDLEFSGLASHNFIVIIPDGGGEPEYYSYGKLPGGNVGLLPGNHPTSQRDRESFERRSTEIDAIRIDAPDDVVRETAKGIISGVPYLFYSTNSNATAQAVAEIAQGGRSIVPPSSSYWGPIGSGHSYKIPGKCP
ncbi:MAG: RHS repeat-associated core domain-containing protein, partial [Halobacteriovoraceae bacterium]|nr:RHS repeat-associated core domain-containing protein [Halobacteriovoraceae bacterium]